MSAPSKRCLATLATMAASGATMPGSVPASLSWRYMSWAMSWADLSVIEFPPGSGVASAVGVVQQVGQVAAQRDGFVPRYREPAPVAELDQGLQKVLLVIGVDPLDGQFRNLSLKVVGFPVET